MVFSDLMDVSNKIFGEEGFDNMKFQLLDFSNVEKVEISEAEGVIIGTLDRTSSVWN